MIKILIILIVAIVVFDIAIIICGKMSRKPADRARDDEEQAEYIRQWRIENDKKRNRKAGHNGIENPIL